MHADAAGSPEGSMGASSTHDQATVAGVLTDHDRAEMEAVGKSFDGGHLEHIRQALAARSGVDLTAPIGAEQIASAVLAQHDTLAVSPSRVVLATLDDLAGVPERPNMPGTIDE